MVDFVSPDSRNYAVFKGSVWFTPEGGTRRHIGNCAGFSFTPEVERLDHYQSMTGIRTRDRSEVVQVQANISIIIEEMTIENFKMALLGIDHPEADTNGNERILLLANTASRGQLEFIGANALGPRLNHTFPSVSIAPSDAVEFIQEEAEWAQITVEAQVESQTIEVDGEDVSYFGITEAQDSGEGSTEAPTEPPTA